jgi:glycosyltransferase involved in cell wall biosynthesis
MRIVQVCFRRYPSPTHVGGGDVRLWQNLCSLTALGHEVHVIACDPRNTRTTELDRVSSSVTTLHSEALLPGTPRWLLSRVFNPASVALAYPDLGGLRSTTSRVIAGINPDLIWAEAVFAVLICGASAPIVHSHHDFHFKLRSVRNQSFAAKRIRRPQALSEERLRSLEIDVCRRAAHTICASRSEAKFLQGMGIDAAYLPVTGPTTPTPNFDALSEGRLFLFGNPNTAMKAARHDLRTRVWPEIEQRGLTLEWHQLGQKPREGEDPSWEWLKERFVIHGFVEDLGDLLLPGDASIMPYPFDTGGRVKFAVGAGYGVVNIAYDTTFECSEEFTHGVDCLAARDPAHFAELVAEFVSDDALRLRLSQGSRAVYEKHFTMESMYPKYQRLISAAINPNAEAVPCAS